MLCVCVAVALLQFCRAQNNDTNATDAETSTLAATTQGSLDSNATETPAPGPSYAEVDR